MIYLRKEGIEAKNGINIYPLSAWSHSRGFILKLGKHRFYFRYSVKLQKLMLGHYEC